MKTEQLKTKHEIRVAGPEHVEQIADLYIRNWREAYKGLLSQDYLDSLTMEGVCEKWRDYIAQPNQCVFMVMETTENGEEKVGGFVGVKPYHRIENCIYVYSLHVEKHLRGRGIGTALVEKIAEKGCEEGYPLMGVCVVVGNDNARRLYAQLGAEFCMYIDDGFAGDPVKSEVMVWDLVDGPMAAKNRI